MANIIRQDSYAPLADGSEPSPRHTRRGEAIVAPLIQQLLFEGRVFVSSDADENDRVTGQTSYAATTPTFLLDVPSGSVAIPLAVNLGVAGTVAGGVISAYLSFDKIKRYSSGGTSEGVTPMRTDAPVSAACKLYSGATAAAASEARLLWAKIVDPDVATDPTDESIHLTAFDDFIPPVLIGPAAFMVFTYAASTGPTWEWSISWAELPAADFV